MNTNKYLAWCSACIVILVGVLTICLVEHIEYQVTSTPVEEMYHRQLVVTLDSILDARFGSGCCEEDIDSDDVSISQTLFHNRSSMEMME